MRETEDRNIEKYKIFQESGKNVWCEDKGCPSGTGSTGSIPQRLNDNLRTILSLFIVRVCKNSKEGAGDVEKKTRQ